mgnify:CR=1 FL=1
MNREKRYGLANRALESCIEENAEGKVILVEGKRDEEALRDMGFKGTIELLNRGWDQSRLIAYLYDTYGSINPIDSGPPVIVLMDWDRTGDRLQKEITTRLQSLDIAIDLEPRRTLSRAFRPETLCVEGIRKFISDLRPLIDVNDPEGADELHLL